MRSIATQARHLTSRLRNKVFMEALEPRLLLSQVWIVAYTSNAATNGTNLNNILNGTTKQAGLSLELGDTIVLQAGEVWLAPVNNSFVLQNITVGTGVITIESSDIYNNLGHLPANARVGPSQSAYMPQLETGSSNKAVFTTVASAHNYSLIGLEILPSAPTVGVIDLVTLGDGSSAQNTVTSVPTGFVLDRDYIHSYDATATVPSNTVRGVTLNSANTTIENSYISDIHNHDEECKAIEGWNGTGGYLITNNFLEASGENVMFGGADTYIPNNTPTNITITHNYFFKPLSWDQFDPSWDGNTYIVKNLLEFKMGVDVIVDQNLFENCWVASDQVGEAIAVGPKNADGGNTWTLVSNVSLTNNVIRNVGEGIQLGFSTIGDTGNTCLPMHDVLVRNNLIETVNGAPSAGEALGIEMGAETAPGVNLTIDHNTIISSHDFLNLNPVTIPTGDPIISSGFTCTNNIFEYGQYGLFGGSAGSGTTALAALCPGGTFTNNAIIGMGTAATTLYNPLNNYFAATEDAAGLVDPAGENYGVLATLPGGGANPLHNGAKDGTDVGALMSGFTGITDFTHNDTSLQNYYKFDEGSGTTTSDNGTGTHHNATLNGSVTWTAAGAGEMNYGLNFVGGNTGNVSVSSFSTTSNFTFAAWINTASTSTPQYIASASNSAFSLSLNGSGQLVASGVTGTITDSTALTAGQWYLVAVTFDGTNLRLYKDGTLIGSPTTATTNAGTTTLFIGGNKGSTTSFDGTIDEVRYYSSALNGTVTPISTITQMQSLYNGFGPIIDPIGGPKYGTNTAVSINLSTTAIGHATGYGEATNLMYHWSIISGPSGAMFSANNNNLAQHSTLTWASAGKYVLQLTVTDSLGGSTTVLDPITVGQLPQGATVTPSSITLNPSSQQTFTETLGTGFDQFGHALTGTVWTWAVTAASGSTAGTLSSMDGTGSTIYTAPATAGANTLNLRYLDTISGTPIIAASAAITIAAIIPIAPSNLVATPGTSSIALTWTDNDVANTTGYHVYRSTDNSTWGTAIATIVNPSATSYTDSSPSNGVAYYYKVDAYNSAGDSTTTLGQNDLSYPVATVIAYDGFNYATGAWTGGNTGVGFSSNWSISNTTKANIVSGSLTYSSGGHALTTSANKATLNGGPTATDTLATSVGGTGSTLWAGFEISASTSTTSAMLWIGPTGNEVHIGAGANGAGFINARAIVGSNTYNLGAGGDTLTANTTYFLVAEIQYLTTGDVISMWIDPTPGTTPGTPNGTLTLPATSQLTSTNTLQLTQYNGGVGTSTFDELRLGVSYAAVARDPLVPIATGSLNPRHGSAAQFAPAQFNASSPLTVSSNPRSASLFSSFVSAIPFPTATPAWSDTSPDYHLYDSTAQDNSTPLDIWTLDPDEAVLLAI